MKQIVILLTIVCLSCVRISGDKDRVVIDRIEYVYGLKSLIGQKIWQGFDEERFDVPLIYYSGSSSYIANPTAKFTDSFKPDLIFEGKGLKIYKTALLDSIPFHMSVGMEFSDTAVYNYRSPFMYCSSVEITRNTVPDVPSTEVWATMVLHEYFHGFQFEHPEFFDYFEKTILSMPKDSLQNIHRSNEWFRESVEKENDLLLSALEATERDETCSLIDLFFQLREERFEKVTELLQLNIRPTEELFETVEGTARYVEYGLYNGFLTKPPLEKVVESDSCYYSYAYFRDFKFENEQWLYKAKGVSYFYATGFNLARLLDKLKIEYKSRLFNEGKLSLEKVLKSEYKRALQ